MISTGLMSSSSACASTCTWVPITYGSLLPMMFPRAPGYLNSRLQGYVAPRTHYFGNWSPRGDARIHQRNLLYYAVGDAMPLSEDRWL